MIDKLMLRLLWHFFWAGTLFHHGKSGQQKQAEGTANTDLAQQGQLTGAAQGSLGQFEGPVQQSPFYKAMLNTGIQSTSDAYQNASTNMRQRANAAGFGYNQPVTQGAQGQLDAQEAKSMSEVPEKAMLATAPLSLQAAGQTGQMGMGYGAQGLDALNSAYNMQKGRGGLWNQLFNAGVGAGTGLGEAALGA